MEFFALTIFPALFDRFLEYGIVHKNIIEKRISIDAINIRNFAKGRHRVTDDRPYGGGCGMVMKPGPLARTIDDVKKKSPFAKTVLMTPQGRVFNQSIAKEYSSEDGLIFVCGRYEGVDERVCHKFIDDEVSIGDYVLTGGELAAMVVMESVIRLIPGALGGEDSAQKDTFSADLLEHAHFTRPEVFRNMKVPEVLLSGNHQKIEQWRLESALIRTFLKRPDLLAKRPLKEMERDILQKWSRDIKKIIDGNKEKNGEDS